MCGKTGEDEDYGPVISFFKSISNSLKNTESEIKKYRSSREKTADLRFVLSILEAIKNNHDSCVRLINNLNANINHLREIGIDEKYIEEFILKRDVYSNKKSTVTHVFIEGYFCGYEKILLSDDEIKKLVSDIDAINNKLLSSHLAT